MNGNGFRETLILCGSMEQLAAETYRVMSEKAETTEQKQFWRDVANDEERHCGYWDRLLDLEGQGKIRSPFDDQHAVRTELQEMSARLEEMLEGNGTLSDTHERILLAFRMESLMLHPAFCILFRVLKADGHDPSPEDDYQEHMDKFSQFVERYIDGMPEMVFIGELLSNIWKRNRDLAEQVNIVRTLRELIPICSYCKKIRDDQGYWNRLETFLAEHMSAEFTHGICPECRNKLTAEMYR